MILSNATFWRQMKQASAVIAVAVFLAGCSSVEKIPVIYQSLAATGQQLDVQEAQILINSYRQENGLQPLQIEPRLMREANLHARDMIAHDKLGHRVSSRGGFAARLNKAGFNNYRAAENVGAGYHTVAQAFSGWRGSPAHNQNMLLPEARSMGIAAVFAAQSKYKVFWVLIVAADQSGS